MRFVCSNVINHGLSSLLSQFLRNLKNLELFNVKASCPRNSPFFSCPNGCTEQFIVLVYCTVFIVLGIYYFDSALAGPTTHQSRFRFSQSKLSIFMPRFTTVLNSIESSSHSISCSHAKLRDNQKTDATLMELRFQSFNLMTSACRQLILIHNDQI